LKQPGRWPKPPQLELLNLLVAAGGRFFCRTFFADSFCSQKNAQMTPAHFDQGSDRHPRGVFNEIAIEPATSPLAVDEEIAAALGRTAFFGEHRDQTKPKRAWTRSPVRNLMTERGEAERIAWAAAGVTQVTNSDTIPARE